MNRVEPHRALCEDDREVAAEAEPYRSSARRIGRIPQRRAALTHTQKFVVWEVFALHNQKDSLARTSSFEMKGYILYWTYILQQCW